MALHAALKYQARVAGTKAQPRHRWKGHQLQGPVAPVLRVGGSHGCSSAVSVFAERVDRAALPGHAPHIRGLKEPRTWRAGDARADRVEIAALPRSRPAHPWRKTGHGRGVPATPTPIESNLRRSPAHAPHIRGRGPGVPPTRRGPQALPPSAPRYSRAGATASTGTAATAVSGGSTQARTRTQSTV